MKKLLCLFLLLGIGVAHAQNSNQPPYNPAGGMTQGYAVLVDPATGLPCSGAAPCALNGAGQPYQYTTLSPSQPGLAVTTATSLTVPAGAKYAFVTVEGGSVRYRVDGTAPTATVGTLLTVGQQLQYAGNLSTIKFIDATGSTGTIDVDYYK
jgi:hypothetical protein